MTAPRAGALLKRQVVLLVLLRQLGGRSSKLDFQKLLFESSKHFGMPLRDLPLLSGIVHHVVELEAAVGAGAD